MSNADLEASLRRGTRRNGILVSLVMGLVFMLFGAFLVHLGVTWEEPAERIATRRVPPIAPVFIALLGGGVIIAGLVSIIRGARSR